jgi:DNA-directed RNA polymerase specialized sigma24 family protein
VSTPPESRLGPSPDDGTPWFEALFTATYDDLLRYAARRVGRQAATDVVARCS